jgi:hypothetical protein
MPNAPSADMTPPRFLTLVLLAAFAAAPPARSDLAQSSPFLPPGLTGPTAPGGPAGPIELRGVMATAQGAAYCIYDVAKRSGTWVGLNETGNDFVVRSVDATGEGVTVDYKGSPVKLTLRTPKVASAGLAGNPAIASNPMTLAPVLNPTPADEQRRLEAVASEVRRRRLERERAAANLPAQPAPGR